MGQLYVSLVTLSLLAGFVRLLFIGRRPKNYPPGPPTLPILGNLHLVLLLPCHPPVGATELILREQMPTRDAHLQFEKWSREYGPVYSLMLGTKVLIVLSSDEAVKELLDRRSGIYSDRQDMYIGQTLCSGDLRLLMMVSEIAFGSCQNHFC
jgi:Cytochrome P450